MEARKMPPIPDSAKRESGEHKVIKNDDVTELADSDLEEVVDLTDEAKMQPEPSAETRQAIAEALAESAKTLKGAEDAAMLEKAMADAKAAYAPASEAEQAAFQKSIKESSEKLAKAEPKSQEIAIMESSKALLDQDIEVMAQNLKDKFGVDPDVQSSKGLLGRMGMGFRSMLNGELRKAMDAYRAKREKANALGDQIDEEKMTKEDWAKRADRAIARPKPASPSAGGNIGHGASRR